MATRSGMLNLILRLQALCNGESVITATVAQQLLDDRAVFIEEPLRPDVPFYLKHFASYGNLEEGSATRVWYGYNTLLTETTDYTLDSQRGVVTTPSADRRGLRIQSVAYDLYGAAADGWERIALADVGSGDKVSGLGYSFEGGTFPDAHKVAAYYRVQAWPRVERVRRDDTNPDPRWPGDWHAAHRYRAGY